MTGPRPVAPLVRAALVLIMSALSMSAGAAELRGLGLQAPVADVGAAAAALPDPGGEVPRALLRLLAESGARPVEDEAGELSGAVFLAATRARVIVALRESAPVDVRDGAAVDAWAERVASIVERCAGGVAAWEIGEGSARAPEQQAFFIKRTALAIQGVDRRALVLSADPRSLPGGGMFESVSPFVQGFVAPGDEAPQGGMAMLRAGRRASDAAAAWSALVASQENGEAASVIEVPLESLTRERGEMRAAFATAFAAFPEDASPTGNEPAVSFPAEAAISATELVVGSDLSTRVAYRTGLTGRLPAGAVLATFSEEPSGLRAFDPARPEPTRPRVARRGASWIAEVPLSHRAIVLAWDRARAPDEVEEEVAVATEVLPTVEEILAKHFAAQSARDRRLHSYVADLSTEMRYELGASGQAFEVRVEGRYFHDESGIREIENQRFFINGARYDPKHGRAPEIPLLQPETVQVLPLEVRLDKSYSYRLLGRDERGGRPAWKVAFRPAGEDQSAFAGTAWIDAATFDRLAVDLVQTGLRPPVLTNEQVDEFGAVLGDDGEHWLVRESRIHRTVSLLGGTVGVQMRMLFSNFRVNAPGFAADRDAALAGSHQMLRETDEGLKYLRPAEGGGRVESESSSRKLFAAFGARYDDSYESQVIPLAGVNWLDHDLGGRGIQLNVFAAGAINTVSIADPSVFGSRVTIGLDAFVPLVRRRDREALPGTGIDDEENVRSRSPRVTFEVSRPVARHGRIAAVAGLAHESYGRSDDTAADFVVPVDTWVGMLGLVGEIHSKGWDARAQATRHERGDWEDWGRDTGAGPPPLSGDEGQGYWKWGANLAKAWPLGKVQTAGFDAQYLGGSGLDRFSQHEFSAFGGTRLPGFDGSGIHFDEAALLRLSWGFDVGGVFGGQLQVGVGRIWNHSLPAAIEDEFGDDSDQVGIALAGTVPGPWGTIVRFDVGTALYSSDYSDAEGNLAAQVVVLKLLGK